MNNVKQKLLDDFANQSDKLFDLRIIRSDSFTGEIGEYVACELFNLVKTGRSSQAIDGIDTKDKKYQIKAKICKNGKVNYGIGNLDISVIDFLVIVYFSTTYNPKKVIVMKAIHLPKSKINISNKFLKLVPHKIIEENEIKICSEKKKEILKFGELYCLLQSEKIIKSRRIVGDLGEFYASQQLNLVLNGNKNEKGFDGYDEKGLKYEIKTRRVYESERRISKTRRLNNLVGKESEILVVVVLDRSFRCAGMWTIPMKNIHNPKSATLQIVNTTSGVKNIVPSKIYWLK